MLPVEVFRRDPNVRSIAAGKYVFRQGDEGTEMFVLLRGSVSITLGGEEIERVEPGGFFGEMALVEHEPRSAEALALEDVDVAPIDAARFDYLVQNTPYFARVVMKTMAARLRRLNAKLFSEPQ